ncbi:MAG: response regulator [Hydrotalea sp.]|nr:response regulator [Hydrotalea sp.]
MNTHIMQHAATRYILLVEDDPIFQLLHQKLIQKLQWNVELLAAKNGQEALDLLDKVGTSDMRALVLLDINMPICDGWQFLDQLDTKLYKETVQVVVVSSSTDQVDRQNASKYKNVIDYLVKPIKTADLEIIWNEPSFQDFWK